MGSTRLRLITVVYTQQYTLHSAGLLNSEQQCGVQSRHS